MLSAVCRIIYPFILTFQRHEPASIACNVIERELPGNRYTLLIRICIISQQGEKTACASLRIVQALGGQLLSQPSGKSLYSIYAGQVFIFLHKSQIGQPFLHGGRKRYLLPGKFAQPGINETGEVLFVKITQQ